MNTNDDMRRGLLAVLDLADAMQIELGYLCWNHGHTGIATMSADVPLDQITASTLLTFLNDGPLRLVPYELDENRPSQVRMESDRCSIYFVEPTPAVAA